MTFDFEGEEVREVDVRLLGSWYVLTEATEEAAEKYQNKRLEGARMENGEVVGLPSDMAGVQSLLVQDCLFKKNGEGKRQSVKTSELNVKRLPARVVKPLFEWVKENSELDEEDDLESLKQQRKKLDEQITRMEKDSAKNGQSDTTDG